MKKYTFKNDTLIQTDEIPGYNAESDFDAEKISRLADVEKEYKAALARSATKNMKQIDYAVLAYYADLSDLQYGQDWPDLEDYKNVTEYQYTYNEFMNLFTAAEEEAILDATKTDKNVEKFDSRLQKADFILLSDSMVQDGLTYFVSIEIIDKARKTETLAGIVQQ